eukprot:9498400-Pyramimonas_sp.AAC.1
MSWSQASVGGSSFHSGRGLVPPVRSVAPVKRYCSLRKKMKIALLLSLSLLPSSSPSSALLPAPHCSTPLLCSPPPPPPRSSFPWPCSAPVIVVPPPPGAGGERVAPIRHVGGLGLATPEEQADDEGDEGHEEEGGGGFKLGKLAQHMTSHPPLPSLPLAPPLARPILAPRSTGLAKEARAPIAGFGRA